MKKKKTWDNATHYRLFGFPGKLESYPKGPTFFVYPKSVLHGYSQQTTWRVPYIVYISITFIL